MITEGRILDLIADACARERRQAGEWSWTFHHMMGEAERVAFDLFLVRTGDPLAHEAGTVESRFRALILRMVEPECVSTYWGGQGGAAHSGELWTLYGPMDKDGRRECIGTYRTKAAMDKARDRAKRYSVIPWHGEGRSVFYVVDSKAPVYAMRTGVASFDNRAEAEAEALRQNIANARRES